MTPTGVLVCSRLLVPEPTQPRHFHYAGGQDRALHDATSVTLRLVPSQELSPQALVESYFAHNIRCVFWDPIGDTKGPREEGWPTNIFRIEDYKIGKRVGIITGHEIEPGKFLHDVDVDWEPGAQLALRILPPTGFIFGRVSKRISHCFYTLPEACPSFRFEDVDGSVLLELRGVKANGEIGYQTMAPPSEWSKDGKREQLAFVKYDGLTHVESIAELKRLLTLTAIGCLFAKNLGHNGFGHGPRMAWAGFLLRLGLTPDDLILVGEAMCPYTNNTEVGDVRLSVNSTVTSLADKDRKTSGGPALVKFLEATIGTKRAKAVLARVSEWLGKDMDFHRDAQGKIHAKNQDNIKRAIELLGHELSYNEFSAVMLIDGKRLEDPQWKSLYLEIDREYRFQPPLDYFRMVIEDMAVKSSFHPVKQYLDALVWDGKPRIDDWIIKCAGAKDTPYVRAVSSIMLIAAVRRIKQPGCKYDEMVVWESHQGADKSSAAQALCPVPEWFSDNLRLNVDSQELIEATLGKWIIEASDLAGKRKTEIEGLKAMLSRQVDGPARMAYAHFPIERARHFIIVGTTNSSMYLTDSTGGRRFWPITVERFNTNLIRLHRDQMWAEAVVREAQGESIRLAEELWPHATREQEKRREIDPWEGTLREYLLKLSTDTANKRRVQAVDLWSTLNLALERRDRAAAIRLSEIMQRLGFKRTTVRVADSIQTGYVTVNPGALDVNEDED